MKQEAALGVLVRVKADISFRIESNVSYGIYRLTVIFSQRCLDVEDAAERTESMTSNSLPPGLSAT